MVIKFMSLKDFYHEVDTHRLEIEQGTPLTPPVVRVQDYANNYPRPGSILLKFYIEVAAKRSGTDDILICKEKTGEVDHWGPEFPSEDERQALIAKTTQRVKEIKEDLAALKLDVRAGRFMED